MVERGATLVIEPGDEQGILEELITLFAWKLGPKSYQCAADVSLLCVCSFQGTSLCTCRLDIGDRLGNTKED